MMQKNDSPGEAASGRGIVAVDVMSSTNYLECDVDDTLFSDEEPPHTGAWSDEEEEYAERLTVEFRQGNLDLPDGTSLRQFLAKMLHCNPKRISKHYEGTNYSSGRKFYKRASKQLSVLDIGRRQAELNRLRGMYKKRLLRLRMPHMSDDEEEEERASKKAKSQRSGQPLSPDNVPPPVFAPRVSDATFPGNQDAFASFRSAGIAGIVPPTFISRVSGSTLPGSTDPVTSMGASRNTHNLNSQAYTARVNSSSVPRHMDAFTPLPARSSMATVSSQLLPVAGRHSRQFRNVGSASLLLGQLPSAAVPTSSFDSRLRALSMINQLDAETEMRASMLRELQIRRMQRQVGNPASTSASFSTAIQQHLSRPQSVGAPTASLGATGMAATAAYSWQPLPRVAAASALVPSPPLSIHQVEAVLGRRTTETMRSTPSPTERKRKAKDFSKR